MGLLRKWKYDKHKYESYKIPDTWNCKMYSKDMDEFVNCCQCGKKIKYGDTYTSLEIHNEIGFGYAVCEKCHTLEIKRRLENE